MTLEQARQELTGAVYLFTHVKYVYNIGIVCKVLRAGSPEVIGSCFVSEN